MSLTAQEINIRLNNLRRYPNPSGELKVIEKSLFPKNKKLKSESLYGKSQLLEKINLIEKKRVQNEKELDVSIQLLESLKNYMNKLETLYQISEGEKNAMVSASKYCELDRYCEKLENELNSRQISTEKVNSIRNKINNADTIEDARMIWDEVGLNAVNPEVLEYYNDLLQISPKVEKIKDDILKSKTVMEAQSVYYRLKKKIESSSEESSYKIHSPIQETKQHRRFDLNRVKREGWL